MLGETSVEPLVINVLIRCSNEMTDKIGQYFARGLSFINIVNDWPNADLVIVDDADTCYFARRNLGKFFLYIPAPKENARYDFPTNVWVFKSSYLFDYSITPFLNLLSAQMEYRRAMFD